MKSSVSTLCLILLFSCSPVKKKEDVQLTEVVYAEQTPNLDGKATENFWNLTDWHSLDQNWIGGPYKHDDFNGHYKLAWNNQALYILLEITDDILLDNNKDPLKLWWNDDCVAIFIDEDNSGGLHQYNHNAFAYHVALDGNVVDLAPDKTPKLYNDHVRSMYTTTGTKTTWELAVKVFNNDYKGGVENNPVTLKAKKKVGFALAYCDNDKSTERENFIGSIFIEGEDKNQAWINADVFGTLLLKK